MPHPGTITALQLVTHVIQPQYRAPGRPPNTWAVSANQNITHFVLHVKHKRELALTPRFQLSESVQPPSFIKVLQMKILSQGPLYLCTCKKTMCYRSCNPCQTLVDDQNQKGYQQSSKCWSWTLYCVYIYMEEARGVAAMFGPQAKAQPQTEKLVDAEQNEHILTSL